MKKVAGFIVDSRRVILLLFVVLMVYCVWGMSKVNIEYDITSYLPQETDTRKALEIMDKEFVTYGTAKIMIRNIPYAEAAELHAAGADGQEEAARHGAGQKDVEPREGIQRAGKERDDVFQDGHRYSLSFLGLP